MQKTMTKMKTQKVMKNIQANVIVPILVKQITMRIIMKKIITNKKRLCRFLLTQGGTKNEIGNTKSKKCKCKN